VGDFLYNRLELGSGYDVTTFSSFRPDIFWMAGYSFLALSLWHLPIVAAQEKKNRLNTFKFSHDFSIRLVDVLSPTITLIFAPLYMYNAQFWYKTPTVYWMLISSSVAITFFTIFRTALLIVENKNLSQLALRDALTGLFNHRYFQEQLDRELNKAQRQNKPLSIVIMDIDDFAVLNNSYGHQLGDAVLMRFAKILNSMTRSYDTVARLGGDEFGIILPETDSYHAYLLVERIKEAIRESLIDFHSPVTFSAGIAAYPELGVKKEELLSKADNALYWAKYNNKDAVVAYQDTLDFLKPEERIEKIKEQAFLNTVKVLAAAVDARDQFTQFHSRNVSVLAAMLGKEMGLPREKIKLLEIAGLLHDVGKIGISDSILKKEGKLNESERAEIEQHPILAAKILNQSHPKKIVPWILHHHEHWDGKGYPFGLVGEEMPLEARILAICDAYDAMTAERHYRSGMTKEQALEEIQKEAGKQFDPELAKVFVNMMQEKNKQTEILKQNF
jgi:diguanylate cyclase (GGDEF)-like protein/putative nucleotidyltransferase with HDIG domain